MAEQEAAAHPFSTHDLARRLERAEGRANAESIEARRRLRPDSGACWQEFDGTFAMFDGVESPLTQTFGLGLGCPPTPDQLEAIESFFTTRGTPVFHEVSPLANPETVALLNARDYHPIEFTTILCQSLRAWRPATAAGGEVRVREIGRADHALWTDVAAEGWSEFPELEGFMRDIGEVSCERADAACFLAEWHGRAVATGVLAMHEGVALLAGASTIPSARRHGAQLALLEARLRYAADRGCDVAMMGALPGSPSQRNAERHGFRIAYTRLKWRKG
jgi:GNAT superfamily N-acetyltransferase